MGVERLTPQGIMRDPSVFEMTENAHNLVSSNEPIINKIYLF